MLTDIYNYHRIDDRIGTAGQPTADQFKEIAAAGFQSVINLALHTSDDAIPDEGSIVTGLGMTYIHIPVDFETPDPQDFALFSAAMDACQDRHVFVHCAANKRVSAFLYVYRLNSGEVARETAAADLHKLWKPDEVWSSFITRVSSNAT